MAGAVVAKHVGEGLDQVRVAAENGGRGRLVSAQVVDGHGGLLSDAVLRDLNRSSSPAPRSTADPVVMRRTWETQAGMKEGEGGREGGREGERERGREGQREGGRK